MKFFADNPDKVHYRTEHGITILDMILAWRPSGSKSDKLFDFVLQMMGDCTAINSYGYDLIHRIPHYEVNKLDKLLKINPQLINKKTEITEKTILDLWEQRFEHCIGHSRDCGDLLTFIKELKKRGAKRSSEL